MPSASRDRQPGSAFHRARRLAAPDLLIYDPLRPDSPIRIGINQGILAPMLRSSGATAIIGKPGIEKSRLTGMRLVNDNTVTPLPPSKINSLACEVGIALR